MKKILFLLLFPCFCYSQTHSIFTTDGNKLNVVIKELSDKEIIYYNAGKPDKLKTISRSKVEKITKLTYSRPPTVESLMGGGSIIVDEVNVNELPIKYIQVLAVGKWFSNKVKIYVDYGQYKKWVEGGHGSIIRHKDGQPIQFNSVMHAINFFGNNGWRFVDAYAITIDNSHVYHYYFEKEE